MGFYNADSDKTDYHCSSGNGLAIHIESRAQERREGLISMPRMDGRGFPSVT